MGIDVAVGAFDISTDVVTTTQKITLSFQPKVVIFFYCGEVGSTDTIGRGHHKRGIGFAVSASDRRVESSQSTDAAASSETHQGVHEAACIHTCAQGASAVEALADLASMDSDGFTIVIDDQFPLAYRIHYMAIGGTDISNVTTGLFTTPTATGDFDVTSLSFQPDFLIIAGSNIQGTPPTVTIDSDFYVGVADGTDSAVFMGGANSAAASSQSITYCRSARILAGPNGAVNAIDQEATFVSFLSNGFRLNFSNVVATATRTIFLAIKGGLWKVGNLLTQTDTTTDIVESGLGFSPKGAFFVSAGKAEATVISDHDRISMGAFSSVSDRGAQAMLDEDALADTEVTTAVEHDAVYCNVSLTSTIDGLMDIKSVDSDGFTCIMDDADPAQSFVWYFAVGAAAAPSGGPWMLPLLGVGKQLALILLALLL